MFEVDYEGKIAVKDLKSALEIINHRPSDEAIAALVEKLDVDHDQFVPLADIVSLAEGEGLGIVISVSFRFPFLSRGCSRCSKHRTDYFPFFSLLSCLHAHRTRKLLSSQRMSMNYKLRWEKLELERLKWTLSPSWLKRLRVRRRRMLLSSRRRMSWRTRGREEGHWREGGGGICYTTLVFFSFSKFKKVNDTKMFTRLGCT